MHPLRPWGDYSITRLVGAYLGMAVMVVCICLLLQMLLGTERPSWDSSLAVIGTLFLILRMLGKDRWLLRSKPRKGEDVSGVGRDQPCHPELVEEPRLRETAPGRMRAAQLISRGRFI